MKKSTEQLYKPGSMSMKIDPIEKPKKSIFEEKWLAWVMYFVIPIVGVYLFWKNRFYPVGVRILLTILFLVYVVIGTIIVNAINSINSIQ